MDIYSSTHTFIFPWGEMGVDFTFFFHRKNASFDLYRKGRFLNWMDLSYCYSFSLFRFFSKNFPLIPYLSFSYCCGLFSSEKVFIFLLNERAWVVGCLLRLWSRILSSHLQVLIIINIIIESLIPKRRKCSHSHSYMYDVRCSIILLKKIVISRGVFWGAQSL